MYKHIITFLIAFVVAFFFGFLAAHKQYTSPRVTAQTVLQSVQQQGFFVTESIILRETITIDNRSGNALRDFFVSEHVRAQADLRIAMGVDTTLLTADNIQIDGNTIFLTLPQPTLFSTELFGDVHIDTDRGIITRITSGDTDYNGLVAMIKEQSHVHMTDPDILTSVEEGTIASFTRFLQLIAPQYTAVVTFYE